MKKLIFVLSGILLLSLGSCNKDEIKPNQHQDFEIRDFNSNNSGDQKCNSGNNFGGPDNFSDTTEVITDPNRDEDEERKVKRKSKGN